MTEKEKIFLNDAHCVNCRTKNYIIMEFRDMRRKRQQLSDEESIGILKIPLDAAAMPTLFRKQQ
jgi:hypothetical protein